MNIHENSDLCEHIAAGDYPFRVELVMDDHLGLTDGVVSCRHCQRAYLLEMLDWANAWRVFRISALGEDQARRLIRDLTRGSCDVQRAGAEVQHMKTATSFAPWLLLVDTGAAQIRRVAPLASGIRLPGQSWRELACDGSWVEHARTYQGDESGRSSTEIENG
ncbi:MAG: hypothetical protein OES38_14365 [Gammaproteobacteria bacterium]|nr:hypothetical protein [Gammaproteobacteria bacterium]